MILVVIVVDLIMDPIVVRVELVDHKYHDCTDPYFLEAFHNY
jgi:hypothetical protein